MPPSASVRDHSGVECGKQRGNGSGPYVRSRPNAVAAAVGLYITAAYWFTSSTSFANPAVTVARALTESFAGIRPADAPGFIAAQLAGALAASLMAGWLFVEPESLRSSLSARHQKPNSLSVGLRRIPDA